MRWTPIGWSAGLFVLVLLTHTHGNMGCADSRWSIPTAVSLIDQRNFDLDEYLPLLQQRQFSFAEQVRGHYYTVYPFGASILAVPAVAVLRPVARIAFRRWPSAYEALRARQWATGCVPAGGEPVVDLHSWTEQIVASGIVAAATVVMYAIARTELAPGGAAILALLFAFGTSAWSTASRSLWQHGPSMLMLATALLVQLRRWPLLFMGLALGFACVVRPTNVLPLAIGTAWVAFEHPRRFAWYAVGVAIILLPFFANNYRIYGTWLSSYYHPGFFETNPFFCDALTGGLVSPGRGLLVYSPMLLFVPVGVALRLRARNRLALDLSLVACIVGYALAVTRVNAIWWGGFSYGPRFYADIVPYLLYFLVPVIGAIAAARRGRKWIAATAFGITVAASVAAHAAGALSVGAAAWNVVPDDINENPLRLWDWRRPPFLAAWLRDLPPFDLDAVACDRPPGAPTGFALASASCAKLVLSWQPASGAVAEYIVESGVAPGARTFPDRETRSTAPTTTVYRARPGTYYGRVRAKNACGVSEASNELRVVVE